MKEMASNYFNELAKINVNENTDKKGKFTYLSWAWAWSEVKKIYPNASYEIERFDGGVPYLENELGYMVFTKVTINEITHEMWLPVMDFRNNAILKGKATMMEINKAIMRCLVKNIGMHGLGLYIYAGEDLPEETDGTQKVQEEPKNKPKALKKFTPPTEDQVTEISYLLGNERVEKMLEFYKVNFISEIDQATIQGVIDKELITQSGSLDDL